jgi:hypothetical protein
VTVKIDPRVKTPAADLEAQFTLSRRVDTLMRKLMAARADVAARLGRASGEAATAAQKLADELKNAYAPLPALLESLQEADIKPLPAIDAAAKSAIVAGEAALIRAGG